MVNPIPKFAKDVWSKWNIRGVILVSLILQIILIFLAPFRKRSRKNYLVALLWSTYLLADYTASFCVGLIANKYGDKDTGINSVNDFLLAFWTPFLLLHLGGPDTITAFALEDNELWLRHMLGLIVQVCLTVYVFLLTLPKNTLWIPTVLVFTAGIIKFAERTRSLQLASVGHFRQSMVRKPDPGPNYAKLMEEFKSRVDAGLPTEIVTMPEISADDPFYFNTNEQDNNATADRGITQYPSSGSKESLEPDGVDGTPRKIPLIPRTLSDRSPQQSHHGVQENADQGAQQSSSSANPHNGFEGITQHRRPSGSEEPDGVDGTPQKTPPTPPMSVHSDDKAANDKELLSDVDVLMGAYDYFNKFKGIVVDMIFSFHERSESRNYLQKQTAIDALRVIEVELNFIYQAFYTKASVITDKVGFCFRFVSVASLVAALVVFVYDQKHGCEPFDVKVTYILLYGAVALDLVSVFMLVFSDHLFASIYTLFSKIMSDSEDDKGTSKKLVSQILSRILELKRPKWRESKIKEPKWFENKSYTILCRFMLVRRWSESISGFNLVSYCLHDKKRRLVNNKVIEYIGFKEPLEQWLYEKKQPLLQRLWIFIFTELERKSSDADDVETIQRICSSRGEWVLQEGDLSREYLDKLMIYVERNDVAFDQCLMLWHIATDLLFFEDPKAAADQKAEDDRRKMKENKAEDGHHLDLEIGKNIGDDEQRKDENAQNDDDKKETKSENDPTEVHKSDVFEDVAELRDFSKLLSDYLLYLVIMQPGMMSAVRGIAHIRFQDTCAEATNFFNKRQMMAKGEKAQEDKKKREPEKSKTPTPIQRFSLLKVKGMCKTLHEFITRTIFKGENEYEERDACMNLSEVSVDHEPSAVKGDRSKSLLFDACKLANVIKGLKLEETKKWKMIAQVWVELLSYAAANCIPITHVQQLSKGGEFLSLVWLLMTHLGLAKQFQIKEGHARAKLIVGEDKEEEEKPEPTEENKDAKKTT